jgi:purine nucleosidase
MKIIIDSDPGLDDALALIFASKLKDLDIKAITTVFGNSSLENTSINALKILEIINKTNIPVAKGCGGPIIKDLRITKQDFSNSLSPHGSNGLANINLPDPSLKYVEDHAVELLVKVIKENPKDLSLVFLGPLTNLAVMVLKYPQMIAQIKEVIIMGGAVKVSGNVTKYSEFNIWADPEAAKIVFHYLNKKIILVPLDVTTKIIFKDNEIFNKKSEYYQFIYEILKYYSNFHLKVRGFFGSTLHDPFAVGVALDRSLSKIEKLPLDVQIENKKQYGRTYLEIEKVGPNYIDTCTSVSEDQKRRFLDVFKQTLLI